jgi:hypothetical protein
LYLQYNHLYPDFYLGNKKGSFGPGTSIHITTRETFVWEGWGVLHLPEVHRQHVPSSIHHTHMYKSEGRVYSSPSRLLPTQIFGQNRCEGFSYVCLWWGHLGHTEHYCWRPYLRMLTPLLQAVITMQYCSCMA